MNWRSWAYTFGCDLPLEDVCRILNEATPSRWWHHDDSAWYTEYLSCRPTPDTRIRIHNLDESDAKGTLFSAQLDAEDDKRAETDAAFRKALALIAIRDLRPSEIYD